MSIQGNKYFTKVSNTVVNSIAVDDALNNADILVERVAKGFIPLTTSSGGFLNVLVEENEILVLPEGAVVTKVLTTSNDDLEFFTDVPAGIDYVRSTFFSTNNNITNNIFNVTDDTGYIYPENRIALTDPTKVEGVVSLNTISLENPSTSVRSNIGFGRVVLNLDTFALNFNNSDALVPARENYVVDPTGLDVVAQLPNQTVYENEITAYKTALKNATIVVTPGTLEVRIHYIMPFL